MNTETTTSAERPGMIDPDEAFRMVVDAAVARPTCSVPLSEACGLELAQSIHADRNYPPFDRAMMDGYAVSVADAGRTIPVAGEVAAGQESTASVAEGRCVEIMTGAACPPGTEAVVPKEHIRREGDRVTGDRVTGDRVTLPGRIEFGQHIAPQGSECAAGRRVLRCGQTLSPLAVAAVASFGRQSVEVTPRPTLAVITTGTELIPLGQEPSPVQIRDSNGPMLIAMARDMGLDKLVHLHTQDRVEAILDALNETSAADIILLSGGVSVGNYDLVPEALRQHGTTLLFHKVRQKPGKPLLVAKKGQQLVFGLPGNPLSCHFCFHRYVAAAVRRMEGKPPVPGSIFGELAEPVGAKRGRTYFVTARAVRCGDVSSKWRIHALPSATSADIFASAMANCYVEIPPGAEPVPEGKTLPFTWIGNAPWPH